MPRPLKPPPVSELLDEFMKKENPDFSLIYKVGPSPTGKWLHWDKLMSLTPPDGLTDREWWLGVSLSRQPMLRKLPLLDIDGNPFWYATPDDVQRLVHSIDQNASGAIAMPEPLVNDEAAQRHYMMNSLMEEAIRSSQLEGATTTQVIAKEMIRSGRQPTDRSERMILNNYRAMLFMREEIGDRLTPEAVLELHRILTENTLDNPDAAGRLQTPDDTRVVIWDEAEGELVHQPPPAEELPERLDRLCRFANDEEEVEGFLHPVLKALLLHFALAYDHPFEDGNGRTSRALFYWAMKREGYWLTEYLTISRILRTATSKYYKSFLHTETDKGDTTYFVLYQLEVIERAIREFHEYLDRKIREIRQVERALRGRSDHFNHRQLALLSNAIRNPEQRYTFRSHGISHRVSHEAARQDLHYLTRLGFLVQKRVGRQHVFQPVDGLGQKLQGLTG